MYVDKNHRISHNIHVWLFVYKVLCVCIGRAENEEKHFFDSLTFAFYVKFSQYALLWTAKVGDRVLWFQADSNAKRFTTGYEQIGMYARWYLTFTRLCHRWRNSCTYKRDLRTRIYTGRTIQVHVHMYVFMNLYTYTYVRMLSISGTRFCKHVQVVTCSKTCVRWLRRMTTEIPTLIDPVALG